MCVCALFLDSDSTKLCVAEISGELLRECVYLLPQCSAIMKLLIVFAQAACASRKENRQKKKNTEQITKATSFSHVHICVGNRFYSFSIQGDIAFSLCELDTTWQQATETEK